MSFLFAVQFKFIETGKSVIALPLFQEDIWRLHSLKQVALKALRMPCLVPDKPWALGV